MKTRWILVWYLNDLTENDVYLEGVFDTREQAQSYLNKVNSKFGNNVVFSILNIPIE